ncbi:hypothetical protein LXL04_014752 [Taraxacum kok-saghyz]
MWFDAIRNEKEEDGIKRLNMTMTPSKNSIEVGKKFDFKTTLDGYEIPFKSRKFIDKSILSMKNKWPRFIFAFSNSIIIIRFLNSTRWGMGCDVDNVKAGGVASPSPSTSLSTRPRRARQTTPRALAFVFAVPSVLAFVQPSARSLNKRERTTKNISLAWLANANHSHQIWSACANSLKTHHF